MSLANRKLLNPKRRNGALQSHLQAVMQKILYYQIDKYCLQKNELTGCFDAFDLNDFPTCDITGTSRITAAGAVASRLKNSVARNTATDFDLNR